MKKLIPNLIGVIMASGVAYAAPVPANDEASQIAKFSEYDFNKFEGSAKPADIFHFSSYVKLNLDQPGVPTEEAKNDYAVLLEQTENQTFDMKRSVIVYYNLDLTDGSYTNSKILQEVISGSLGTWGGAEISLKADFAKGNSTDKLKVIRASGGGVDADILTLSFMPRASCKSLCLVGIDEIMYTLSDINTSTTKISVNTINGVFVASKIDDNSGKILKKAKGKEVGFAQLSTIVDFESLAQGLLDKVDINILKKLK